MAVAVTGLSGLQRALKEADADTARALRRELREIANDVKMDAQSNVTHHTGRHGNRGPRLADTIKTTTAGSGASVYSNAPHSIVQDSGGQVGNTTVLKRADVSHYMTKAVEEAQPYVERRVGGMLDDVRRHFDATADA